MNKTDWQPHHADAPGYPKRDWCPWCLRRFTLRPDGRLPYHRDVQGLCFGSEKIPQEVPPHGRPSNQ